ncbi:hypothetical protein C4F50_09145 [Flavobacterium sp. KB82]|uniref:Uncharacterized protein n=1 Tax=Flavobacterium hungaricum TaxID=2082725 RepID=A0ABR9TJ99_9FLAO|nr:hypothetical protein [Flavobacterium hungaricum]
MQYFVVRLKQFWEIYNCKLRPKYKIILNNLYDFPQSEKIMQLKGGFILAEIKKTFVKGLNFDKGFFLILYFKSYLKKNSIQFF